MDVKFTKGTDRDFVEARRSDGTIERTTFPKKGLFPHDAVHLIVRSILDAACSQSKVPSPRLSDEDIGDIRAELQRTVEAWREVKVGESLTLAPASGPSWLGPFAKRPA